MKASVRYHTIALFISLPCSLSFRRMTTVPKSLSPNCVRSLEAQLNSASSNDEMSKPMQSRPTNGGHEPNDCPSIVPVSSPQSPLKLPATFPVAHVRNLIFRLSALTGSLSTLVLVDADDSMEELLIPSTNRATLMGRILATLVDVASCLSIDLHSACYKKIDLNARKYPVELCKGKSGKYTEYSNVTGISKTMGQSTIEEDVVVHWNDETSVFAEHVSALTARTRQFAADRDWDCYHTPRNLLLALTGELGELAELFQFKGDEEQQALSMEEHDKIKQEVADVTIYLLRLADVSGVSLDGRQN